MTIPKIVSFLNYKGGVGKTNISVNFAYYCACEKNLKTLLIDWDPQGDATEYIGVGRENVKYTMHNFLTDQLPPEPGTNIAYTDYPNLYLIGANHTLKNAESLFIGDESHFDIFRSFLQESSEIFDIIIIDCPPANSSLNVASIFASSNIFVVTTPSSDSIEKINLVEAMVNQISDVIHSNITENNDLVYSPVLRGIILTMGQKNTIALDIATEHLKNNWGDIVVPSFAPIAVAAQYSVSERIPLLKSRSKDRISDCYRHIFSEVLNRVQ